MAGASATGQSLRSSPRWSTQTANAVVGSRNREVRCMEMWLHDNERWWADVSTDARIRLSGLGTAAQRRRRSEGGR